MTPQRDWCYDDASAEREGKVKKVIRSRTVTRQIEPWTEPLAARAHCLLCLVTKLLVSRSWNSRQDSSSHWATMFYSVAHMCPYFASSLPDALPDLESVFTVASSDHLFLKPQQSSSSLLATVDAHSKVSVGRQSPSSCPEKSCSFARLSTSSKLCAKRHDLSQETSRVDLIGSLLSSTFLETKTKAKREIVRHARLFSPPLRKRWHSIRHWRSQLPPALPKLTTDATHTYVLVWNWKVFLQWLTRVTECELLRNRFGISR